MYKVLIISTIGSMEDELNKEAKNGYEAVYFYQHNANLVIIMREKPKVGRPSKNDKGE